jgi:hypothetical protein
MYTYHAIIGAEVEQMSDEYLPSMRAAEYVRVSHFKLASSRKRA